DQDVSFPAPDALQRARELLPASRAVAVDADDARGREARCERLLDALRAASHRLEIHMAADRTGARNRLLRAAVMAAQAAPSIGGVQHHARGAAPAAGGPAARFAREHRRIAAPVDEDQALLAAGQPVGDFIDDFLRKTL